MSQAAVLLQRSFRLRRKWATELAKMRAVLCFERAAITGAFFKSVDGDAGPLRRLRPYSPSWLGALQLTTFASRGSHGWLEAMLRTLAERPCRPEPSERPRHGHPFRSKLRIAS